MSSVASASMSMLPIIRIQSFSLGIRIMLNRYIERGSGLVIGIF